MKTILNFLNSTYPNQRVNTMLRKERLNFLTSDWGDECEIEEDIVINLIIDDIKSNIENIPINIDLVDLIKDKYPQLDYKPN